MGAATVTAGTWGTAVAAAGNVRVEGVATQATARNTSGRNRTVISLTITYDLEVYKRVRSGPTPVEETLSLTAIIS